MLGCAASDAPVTQFSRIRLCIRYELSKVAGGNLGIDSEEQSGARWRCSRRSPRPALGCRAGHGHLPRKAGSTHQAARLLRPLLQEVRGDSEQHHEDDGDASHKHPTVRAWLAERPRWHMHFVPTYSSWLNQVERFFSIITTRAIRRGSFTSVKDLTNKIDKFVNNYNQTCQPFTWTATADSILEKLARLCGRISGTGH